MVTNYSRWKPILLVCRLSDTYFIYSSAGRLFSVYNNHSISSLFPTFLDTLTPSLLPLHLMAPLKSTTPLSLLPFTTNQISKSSSIFSLLSDRNFLGMDEKFAISLGWMSRSSGVFPSFNVSLLLLLDNDFTNLGYPTSSNLPLLPLSLAQQPSLE